MLAYTYCQRSKAEGGERWNGPPEALRGVRKRRLILFVALLSPALPHAHTPRSAVTKLSFRHALQACAAAGVQDFARGSVHTWQGAIPRRRGDARVGMTTSASFSFIQHTARPAASKRATVSGAYSQSPRVA